MHALMVVARSVFCLNNRLIRGVFGRSQPARIVKPCLAQHCHELIVPDRAIETFGMKRLPSVRELTSESTREVDEFPWETMAKPVHGCRHVPDVPGVEIHGPRFLTSLLNAQTSNRARAVSQ
jgi:hypothetical protein